VLSQDYQQWILTLITSVVGGLICGFAAQPAIRTNFLLGNGLNFLSVEHLVYCGMIVTRTSEWLPLVRNITGFLIGVLVCLPVSVLSRSSASKI